VHWFKLNQIILYYFKIEKLNNVVRASIIKNCLLMLLLLLFFVHPCMQPVLTLSSRVPPTVCVSIRLVCVIAATTASTAAMRETAVILTIFI
jgi:hypothetical protein